MNFVVLYCNKNQYEMFEEFSFKYSPVDFSKVDILVFDDNSIPKQKRKLKELSNKYDNITWINPDVNSDTDNAVVSSFKSADTYLKENKIDTNWILFFENDVFPFQSNFWEELNKTIDEHDFVEEEVGLIGFSSYQRFQDGLKRTPGSPTIGRGNLLDGILEPPHSGWYKDLPDEYYNTDYFVVEVPNWQSVCVNRKLFREFIEIDIEHIHRLLSVDSVSHQFMYKGIFNIVFPKLSIYHDSGELKNNINLKIDNSYSRSNNSEEIFMKRWGWSWGYRNTNLRSEFIGTFPKYLNKIQDKLFRMNVLDGPKKIGDFCE